MSQSYREGIVMPQHHVGSPSTPRNAMARSNSDTPSDMGSPLRQRAVSDAAQYARNRRQSELMKELMPAGKGGAQPHNFRLTTYSKAIFCGVCSKFLWGFSRQGYKCIDCGFDAHRHCRGFAPACLGKSGSVASGEQDGFIAARMGLWRVHLHISSADGLARKSMFRMPDPFCIAEIDKNTKFRTPVARKTLCPVWNSAHQFTVDPTSQLSLYVFDGKRYQEGSWDAFLGMCIIPASVLLDTGSLGGGATGVLTFRLKKRQEQDTVTGRIVLKVDRLQPAGSPSTPTAPIDIPGSGHKNSAGGLGIPESPALLATSPGSGWQKLLPEFLPDSPKKSLVAPRPMPPTCELLPPSETNKKQVVRVQWDGGTVTGKETGVQYTLAVVDESGGYHDIYTGHDTRHDAVGFNDGQKIKFVVKAFNFFGSSEYSAPSEEIVMPETNQTTEEDTRQHCPLFMAGLCFRGAACPMSHGTGLQNADDVAAALMAAAAIGDPDIQMAAAMAASLADYSRATFDPSNLPQYKREFHSKLTNLRSKVCATSGTCEFTVTRVELFKSSFFEVSRRKPSELKRRLVVQFAGEGGLDYGGLAREWFNLVSREIFHPDLGMFEYISDEDYALTISSESSMEADHLLYFQFVGRLLGLAVLHAHFVDTAFTSVFCKRILDLPITISDLQEVDADLHRSMLWVLENDISDVPGMTFSADYSHFGEMKTYDLVENGQNIEVTEGNKHRFVESMVAWRLTRNTDRQLAALLHGLHEIIPREELLVFNERELQFLLCGTRELDVEDWKAHTIYEGCSANSTIVKYLWEIVEAYSAEEKAKFLQFCTGSSRVPVEGFQSLQGSDGARKFCIQLVDNTERLPSAHTCFNRLDLPKYDSKQELETKLKLAVHGAEGFAGD
eukprot:m.181931 g.181931  ORF g.181931 m.181931 type:complete len:896 (-) comp15520_c2_seq6:259-2946(-)